VPLLGDVLDRPGATPTAHIEASMKNHDSRKAVTEDSLRRGVRPKSREAVRVMELKLVFYSLEAKTGYMTRRNPLNMRVWRDGL
jgi:hypothetical protein